MATACCSSDQPGCAISGRDCWDFPFSSGFSTFKPFFHIPWLFHICTSIHSFLHHSCALPRLLSRPTLNPCLLRRTSGQPAHLRTGSPAARNRSVDAGPFHPTPRQLRHTRFHRVVSKNSTAIS